MSSCVCVCVCVQQVLVGPLVPTGLRGCAEVGGAKGCHWGAWRSKVKEGAEDTGVEERWPKCRRPSEASGQRWFGLKLCRSHTCTDAFRVKQQVNVRHFITRLIWSLIMWQRGHTRQRHMFTSAGAGRARFCVHMHAWWDFCICCDRLFMCVDKCV